MIKLKEENELEFVLLDNNCLTKHGELIDWLKQKSLNCTKLNIASAFFYNLVTKKSINIDLFQYLIENNPLIEINIIISNRITKELKDILEAWLKKEDLHNASEEAQKLLFSLNQLNIKFFMVNHDIKGITRFFHPKLYLLEEDNFPRGIFFGSGNLTPAGLSSNIELMLYETESRRCKIFHNWFYKLLNIAEPFTELTLRKIKFISSSDRDLSCEIDTEYKELETFKTRIELIKLGNEVQNIDYRLKENNKLVLNGMVIYDYETGQQISIELKNIISWGFGIINDLGQFESLHFSKIAKDDIIEQFFKDFEISSFKGWLDEFKKNFKEITISAELIIENYERNKAIQVLTDDGKLYQEDLNL